MSRKRRRNARNPQRRGRTVHMHLGEGTPLAHPSRHPLTVTVHFDFEDGRLGDAVVFHVEDLSDADFNRLKSDAAAKDLSLSDYIASTLGELYLEVAGKTLDDVVAFRRAW